MIRPLTVKAPKARMRVLINDGAVIVQTPDGSRVVGVLSMSIEGDALTDRVRVYLELDDVEIYRRAGAETYRYGARYPVPSVTSKSKRGER